jgi:peptide/nickel transport system permease protein
MITENRQAISAQPWSVAAPVILIAVTTLAINLVGDALARSQGRTLGAAGILRR